MVGWLWSVVNDNGLVCCKQKWWLCDHLLSARKNPEDFDVGLHVENCDKQHKHKL